LHALQIGMRHFLPRECLSICSSGELAEGSSFSTLEYSAGVVRPSSAIIMYKWAFKPLVYLGGQWLKQYQKLESITTKSAKV